LFASAALGWRFEATLGVVVVVERGRRVVELACLVVGEAGGVTVGRVREDGHTLVVAGERGGSAPLGCSSAAGADRSPSAVALAFALEDGRGFPVAKRAGGDAELGGDSLLCHSLAEQLRRPLLFSSSLLAAAALIGELLFGPRPHRLAAPAKRDAALPRRRRPRRRSADTSCRGRVGRRSSGRAPRRPRRRLGNSPRPPHCAAAPAGVYRSSEVSI